MIHPDYNGFWIGMLGILIMLFSIAFIPVSGLCVFLTLGVGFMIYFYGHFMRDDVCQENPAP